MNEQVFILSVTAASLGFMHTIFGPDHYLPFIVLSKARKWSIAHTVWITLICGIGHVGSSIILGTIGIALGLGLHKVQSMESVRGDYAAWALLVFGLIYMTWGLWKVWKNKPHRHFHSHEDGFVHEHDHSHAHNHDNLQAGNHDHKHKEGKKENTTPWFLFIIFVLGPCEVLIPLLIYPAARIGMSGVAIVSFVFSIATVATMLTVVVLLSYGLKSISFGRFEKYTNVIAGAAISLSGIAIIYLGL